MSVILHTNASATTVPALSMHITIQWTIGAKLAPISGICKPSRVIPKEVFASFLHGSHMRAVYLSLCTGSLLTACKE